MYPDRHGKCMDVEDKQYSLEVDVIFSIIEHPTTNEWITKVGGNFPTPVRFILKGCHRIDNGERLKVILSKKTKIDGSYIKDDIVGFMVIDKETNKEKFRCIF